jgi:hypothetical protein
VAEELRVIFFISTYCSPQQLHHEIDDLYLDDLYLIVGDDAIAWGNMILEGARWRMYRWILHHLEVDWVVLLSEQDYPIRPLAELRKRLAEADADAFIRGRRVDQIADARERREWERPYFYQYRWSLPRLEVSAWLPNAWRIRCSQ